MNNSVQPWKSEGCVALMLSNMILASDNLLVSRYGHTSNLEIHFCRILFSVLKGTQKICASSVPLTLSSLWLRVVPFASGGGKLLETPGAIYTKTLVGRVWKVLEMPRDVHTSLHYGGRHERSPRLLENSRDLFGHSKGSMSGSNVEETSEQTRGRKMEHTAQGRGRKDKSSDTLANMETRLAKVELAMADTWEWVDLIEQGMKKGLEDLREQIQDLREGVLGSQVQPVSHEILCPSKERQELAIYKVVVSAWVMATHEASRVEVPKPHGFSGKRDAKELDNFLWHMERYFEAIALTDEATKVCRYGERHLHHRDVGGLKREIKRQFYPKDVAYLDRKNIRRLKHTGSICDYVKEFSSLMLEIPNMIEEELLFNFMDNLQGWAEQELRRRGVQDLATAIAVAESLMDYKRGDSSKVESLEDSHATGGEDEVPRDHNAPKKGSGKTPNVREGRDKAERKEFTLKTKCFLCDGPHWARDCLKRKALSAMIEEREQEDEAHMGSMQLL
ncbi:hypothetical protein CK203_112385, partial [Vitis vinifera]